MNNPGIVSNFNLALLNHFRLKTRILLIIFLALFVLQVCALGYALVATDWVGTMIPTTVVVLAPILIISIITDEFLTLYFINRAIRNGTSLNKTLVYLVTFLEVSFPTIVMSISSYFASTSTLLTPLQLVNSPVMMVYFVMIILSILLLNARLCIFAGIVAGIEYAVLNVILFNEPEFSADLKNALAKSVFMVLCALLAGLISKRIREAISSDLHAKAELIHELDSKVAEKTREVVAQKEQIEQKNKELMDSINYAERIQRSLMASKKMLDQHVPDHFVYLNPKEAVSGDFYWASPVKAHDADEKFILVCADSTGHGVPGAIMSMMNMNSFKESVKDGRCRPDEILNQTRTTIIQTLANDGSAEGGKDGMDAALIILDSKKSMLEFSLANNPLWLVRNNELLEYKPDKMPVGKHDRQNIPFTLHQLPLQKNDIIYLFTDGFADQFGGDKGKKFKYATLKDLLLSISSKAMQEQKTILHQTFVNWRGGLEQVDDVCVIGIRV